MQVPDKSEESVSSDLLLRGAGSFFFPGSTGNFLLLFSKLKQVNTSKWSYWVSSEFH